MSALLRFWLPHRRCAADVDWGEPDVLLIDHSKNISRASRPPCRCPDHGALPSDMRTRSPAGLRSLRRGPAASPSPTWRGPSISVASSCTRFQVFELPARERARASARGAAGFVDARAGPWRGSCRDGRAPGQNRRKLRHLDAPRGLKNDRLGAYLSRRQRNVAYRRAALEMKSCRPSAPRGS